MYISNLLFIPIICNKYSVISSTYHLPLPRIVCPYRPNVHSLNIPLHNTVTQQMVATEVTCRLLKAFETGERLYQAFRNERFKTKTVKLSAKISKISRPRFDIHVTGDKFLIHKLLKKHATNLRQVAAA